MENRTNTSSVPSSLTSFPFLTSDEFQRGCEALLRRIRNAGGAHDMGWSRVGRIGGTDSPYMLSIVKHSVLPNNKPTETLQTGPEEPASSNISSMEGIVLEDDEEEEEDDNEALVRQSEKPSVEVKYDIILSPTYQVPVLYLTVPSLAQVGMVGIEGVYRHLVPPQQRSALKGVGLMGGISFGYHPQSGIPTYFVHPCNTATAMANIVGEARLDPEGYLLAWLGLVGNGVNLYVPSQLWQDGGATQVQSF